MAAVSQHTRSQNVKSYTQAYASTSAITPVSPDAQPLHICYAVLTGAMTINATLTKLQQWQEVYFHFLADTSNETVTFGTGFTTMGNPQLVGDTLTVPIGKDATVRTIFDGATLRVVHVSCAGRGETTESPAYAAAIEVTDQAAKRHIVSPAQLTGALTLNATAVTKHIVGDEFVFHFSTDGTQRIVTFGTGFLSSGTVTIPANKTATARGYFNGTSICITSREISA
jgi:hypothetical protein